MNRRDCLKTIAATSAAASLPTPLKSAGKFAIDYVLASSLYGDMPLSRILPELEHTGAVGLDLWGSPHGTQREEVDKIGVDGFARMLSEYNTTLTVSTRYPQGCFGLQTEMPVVKKLGGKIIVAGTPAVKGGSLDGQDAKRETLRLIEKMIPHADAAGEHGLTIALANHSEQLISHPDSIRYFAEYNRHPSMGMALAPHHLKGQVKLLPELILELGKENLPFIYFQEYGDGAYHQVQRNIQQEQLPGRGPLDYSMIVRALKLIDFDGIAEICMHTTPRGLPIADNAEEITELINESRSYIDGCVRDLG